MIYQKKNYIRFFLESNGGSKYERYIFISYYIINYN
jgi:hypothetical protein